MSLQDFSADNLRKNFLAFFQTRGHKAVSSASLIPKNDPTVLFTTAGMHPLVPYLMGEKHPEGQRLVNIQPCIRTDDIDEVGDNTHLTFFEMMGNWSLGDSDAKDGVGAGYWKEDAIRWSFEFLTGELGIDVKSLAVSCFGGDDDATRDEESAEIWKSLGIAESRIAYLGKKDNWWGPAGQTGPCGPDTEMFVWCGNDKAPDKFNGPDDERWVEIWNDVFMQYDKKNSSLYEPLKQKNVDTGIGFERLLAYLNDTDDIYKTEVFAPIIKKIEEISGRKYEDNKKEFRIIADHTKASVFILAEKVEASNKLHGYILRRLIRRAITKSISLGIDKNFCADLAKPVFAIYKGVYGQLDSNRDFILKELEKEENKFRKTLKSGMKKIDVLMQLEPGELSLEIKQPRVKTESNIISGKDAFNLYQTYGFPLELIKESATEKGCKVDENAFNAELKKHQEKSRTASAGMFKGGLADNGEVATRMHSATHLLLAALRQVLGDHVIQRGSNITSERIRFDFFHPDKLTDEQIAEVEKIVNQKIKEDLPVKMTEMGLEEAKKSGVMAVFDDKYGDRVKVYSVGDFSAELCGGPHVKKTGEIGNFKITKQESSSAGVRRIKATVS